MKGAIFFCLILGFFFKTQAYELEVKESHVNGLSHFYSSNADKLKIIKDSNYYGIEVLVAGENPSQIASRFGHLAIRFVGSGDNDLQDKVVSLEMFVSNPDNMVKNAFWGGYELFPHVYSLIDFVNTYQVNEGRSIKRIVLPAKKENTAQLLDLFEKMMTVPDLLGDYNFLRNNCMTALLTMLNASNLISNAYFEHPVDIPMQAVSLFNHQVMSPYAAFSIPSSASILKFYAERFYKQRERTRSSRLSIGFDDKALINTLVEKDFWTDLSSKVSSKEAEIINFFWPQDYLMNSLNEFIPERAIEAYIRIIMSKSSFQPEENLNTSYGLDRFTQELYVLCSVEDQRCRKKRLEVLSSSDLIESVQHVTRHWWRSRNLGETIKQPNVVTEDHSDLENWYDSPLTQDMLLLHEEVQDL